MRTIHFSDHLEKQIAQAFDEVGIEYIHESENGEQDLDFYLPFFDVYIEVKQFHADRIARQMSSKDNVIAVQGRKSVELLIVMLMRSKKLAVLQQHACSTQLPPFTLEDAAKKLGYIDVEHCQINIQNNAEYEKWWGVIVELIKRQ